MWGQAGNDVMYGEGGDDFMDGGTGTDLMYGGDHDDDMEGEGDADIMYGGEGADELLGGLGNDLLTGDGGTDTFTGNAGQDSMHGSAGDDHSTVVTQRPISSTAEVAPTTKMIRRTRTTPASTSSSCRVPVCGLGVPFKRPEAAVLSGINHAYLHKAKQAVGVHAGRAPGRHRHHRGAHRHPASHAQQGEDSGGGGHRAFRRSAWCAKWSATKLWMK